jgi:hypothetical protein
LGRVNVLVRQKEEVSLYDWGSKKIFILIQTKYMEKYFHNYHPIISTSEKNFLLYAALASQPSMGRPISPTEGRQRAIGFGTSSNVWPNARDLASPETGTRSKRRDEEFDTGTDTKKRETSGRNGQDVGRAKET